MTTTRLPDEATEDARLAGIRSRLLGAVAQQRTPRFSRARKTAVAAIAAASVTRTISSTRTRSSALLAFTMRYASSSI